MRPPRRHPKHGILRSEHVSEECLRAFRTLPAEEKLRWLGELATFCGQPGLARKTKSGKARN